MTRKLSIFFPGRKLEHAGKDGYETAPMFAPPPSNTRQGGLIQIVYYEKQMDGFLNSFHE